MNISPTRELDINLIRIDGGTQARAEINQAVVDQYAEDVDKLPPVTVFIDGNNHWLVDGFHRYFAHLKAKQTKIVAACRSGTQRAAVLASLEQNASHGLQRTPEDKRKSVVTMLSDKEWAMWSDREIADHCRVSHTHVANVRRDMKQGGNVATPKNLAPEVKQQVDKIREEGGTPRLMKVQKEGEPEKTVAFDATKRTSAANQHTAKKEGPEAAAVPDKANSVASKPSPEEPGKPWAAFESAIKDAQSQLRSIARELGATLGYDATAKRLTSKWAHYYSHAGTIGAINQIIRTLEDGMPAEVSSQAPGYVSNQRLEVLSKSKAVA